MKKLKIFAFISIDGYCSRINGDIDWVPSTNGSPLGQYGLPTFLESIDTIVMNRMQSVLIQNNLAAWPISDKICYVLSYKGQSTMQQPPIKSICHMRPLIIDDSRGILERIRALQLMGGRGHIWAMGDHRLTAYLLQYDMIDEINIVRLPVLLGSGLTFFGDFGIETQWNIEDYNKYDNGVLHIKYGKVYSETEIA
ncbi:MAG: dihydrofolate reductase family protein [Tannerellaceae bacterium]|jgi:dihydrofolate reductase|nr:dihydrofolate reductase family protein [Tannerellaceae bacterium]